MKIEMVWLAAALAALSSAPARADYVDPDPPSKHWYVSGEVGGSVGYALYTPYSSDPRFLLGGVARFDVGGQWSNGLRIGFMQRYRYNDEVTGPDGSHQVDWGFNVDGRITNRLRLGGAIYGGFLVNTPVTDDSWLPSFGVEASLSVDLWHLRNGHAAFLRAAVDYGVTSSVDALVTFGFRL